MQREDCASTRKSFSHVLKREAQPPLEPQLELQLELQRHQTRHPQKEVQVSFVCQKNDRAHLM